MAFTLGAPLQAANLVLNGGFELLTMTSGNAAHSTIIGDGTNGLPVANNWSSSQQGGRGAGYNFVAVNNPGYFGGGSITGADDLFDDAYTNGNAGGAGGGDFALWGPDSGSNNGLINSPVGGNFLVADGSYLNRPVEQTITGMTIGQTYHLSFYWAAAQQAGFNGDTKEAWVVCIGTCGYTTAPGVDEALAFFNADAGNTDPSDPHANNLGNYDANLIVSGTDQIFKTGVVTNPDKGFTPWQFESFSFTATSTSATLSLLAYGTPIGQPPFALIDGITIDTPVPMPVPEPTSWAMMLIGFGVIGGVMRTRRRSTNGRDALASQII
ncbi:MAG: PEP-CTERM sorting domain-containing protein [Rhizorhabdus sp.]|nr:PEP-CTERM sorting domain-containing protein [Rhizorhabdus sp.]